MGEPVDFWEELDEAAATVARWPAWRRRYDADEHYGEDGEDAVFQLRMNVIVSPST